MKCKYCDALLEEGVTLCPVCGKENAEPAETVQDANVEETVVENAVDKNRVEGILIESPSDKKKVEKKGTKPWMLFLTAFCGVLAGVILVCAVLYATGVAFRSEPEQETSPVTDPTQASVATDPTAEPATEPTITIEASGQNDVKNKVSYTVADEEAEQWASQVIAKVGDMELTNSQLQLYYWTGVIDFLNNYSYYLSGMGLDYTKPLDQQVAMEGDMTWEQFFLETALLTWHKYAVLVQQADADSFTLTAETQTFLDGLTASLEAMLAESDYETVDQMLQADVGALVNEQAYYDYMHTYNKALDYFDSIYNAMTPTDDEVLKFFRENEETFAQSGVTMESGKYYDVRHILIEPEGGETAEDGTTTYTDAQWEACRIEAQALLDQWKAANGTEDDFAALATEHSGDIGSQQNGGLYANLTKETNFVTEFKDWYMDENRKSGDTGLVKSSHGYHIMFFVDSRDIWFYEAYNAAHQENANKAIEQMMTDKPMEVTYENIAIGNVKLG